MECPACRQSFEVYGVPAQVRVTSCNSCHAVLTSTDGSTYKDSGQKVDPQLAEDCRVALGTEGQIQGKPWTVVGRIRHQWQEDGETGFHIEYVLYNPHQGYAYLDHERGHFLFGRQIEAPAGVNLFAAAARATVKTPERNYTKLEEGRLTVTWLDGSIPYDIELGESVRFADATSPPFLLTQEIYELDGGGQEIEFALSEYVSQDKIAKRFGTKAKPKGIHAAQPYLPVPGESWIRRIAIVATLLVFGGFCYSIVAGERLHQQTFTVGQLRADEALSEPFEIPQENETLEVELKAGVNNRWADIGVGLVQESTGAVLTADDGLIEYYSGVEGGESWSEGSQSHSFYWKVKEPGRYRLVLKTLETDDAGSSPITVTVMGKVQRSFILLILFLLWPILPFYLYLRKRGFEKRRWADL